jgi:hypothetical protein
LFIARPDPGVSLCCSQLGLDELGYQIHMHRDDLGLIQVAASDLTSDQPE